MMFRQLPGSKINRSKRSQMKNLQWRKDSLRRKKSSSLMRRVYIKSRIKTILYNWISSPRTKKFQSKIKLFVIKTILSRFKRETSKKSFLKWRKRLIRKLRDLVVSLVSKKVSFKLKLRKTMLKLPKFMSSMSRFFNSKIKSIILAKRRMIYRKKSLIWVNMISN